MQKISSDTTTVAIKAYILVPLFILPIMLSLDLLNEHLDLKSGVASVVLGGAWLAIFWYAKAYIWNLADEAYDDGNSLLIKRGKWETRIMFEDIDEITDKTFSRPPKIRINYQTKLSSNAAIEFVPIGSSGAFTVTSSFVMALQKRIFEARAKKAAEPFQDV